MNKNHLIIWLLASFLIAYHTVKISTGLIESADAAASIIDWSHIYSVRLWIVFSLLLVIMFKRSGIISMWLLILVLVVIQYVHLTGGGNWYDYFSPLKGFVLPLVITWMFWRNRQPVNQQQSQL